jgi:uncharacterized protein YbjT (DUF2867 family)
MHLSQKREVYFITGATGNVGQHLVSALKEHHHVRALTRNPQKANLPDNVEVIKGDLTQPDTFASAFEGITGLHLITANGDYEPLTSAPEIVRLAEEAGIRHITVLWSGTEGPVEEAIKASSLGWTILRPQEFMANALEWTETIREERVVREAFGDHKTAMIHEGDIARVAATALTEKGHHRQEYTLTGPEVLTIRDAVKTISRITDQKIQFEELTEEQALKRMIKAGIKKEEAEYVLSWYRDNPEEGYTVLSTVEKVTGQQPRSFRQWVQEHMEDFT